MSVVAVVFFPITIIVWPLASLDGDIFGLTLWWLLIAALVVYPISTFVGGLSPIDRPGDI